MQRHRVPEALPVAAVNAWNAAVTSGALAVKRRNPRLGVRRCHGRPDRGRTHAAPRQLVRDMERMSPTLLDSGFERVLPATKGTGLAQGERVRSILTRVPEAFDAASSEVARESGLPVDLDWAAAFSPPALGIETGVDGAPGQVRLPGMLRGMHQLLGYGSVGLSFERSGRVFADARCQADFCLLPVNLPA